jgi:hypothetical protein
VQATRAITSGRRRSHAQKEAARGSIEGVT